MPLIGEIEAGSAPLGTHGVLKYAVAPEAERYRRIMRALYLEPGKITPDNTTIAYCRIGERSSHTWFVLHELLGLDKAKNYDGSWTEYGSLVGVPIEKSPTG